MIRIRQFILYFSLVGLMACSGSSGSKGTIVGTGGATSGADGGVGGPGAQLLQPDGADAGFPMAIPVARFQLAEESAATPLGDIPFPSDMYRAADGRLDLQAFPHQTAGSLIDTIVEAVEKETPGFGTTSTMYLGFEGQIDTRPLPTDGLASRQTDSSLFVVNVDRSSPEYGQRMPVDWKVMPQNSLYMPPNTLGIRLVEGLRLQANTLYAVAATTQVAKAAPAFVALMGKDRPDGLVGPAWDVHSPLREWANSEGVELATGTVFTTQDPTSELFRTRDFIHTLPAPEPQNVESQGERNGAFEIFVGTYTAPRFQEGEIPYLASGTGAFRFKADGTPIVQAEETLRFALTVPTDREMPEGGWPVVMYGHGTGGNYQTFLTNSTKVGLVLARAGIAVISIDQIHHGTRDTREDDCQSSANRDNCVSLLFFNFIVPTAGRDNVRQSALDFVSLTRLVRNFDIEVERETTRISNGFSLPEPTQAMGGMAVVGGIPSEEPSNGGMVAMAGSPLSGGMVAMGGSPASEGMVAMGGSPASGGMVAMGGSPASAGSAMAGGQPTGSGEPSEVFKVRIKLDPERVIYMGHSQGGLNGPLFLAVEQHVLAGVLSAAGASFPISIEQKTKPLNINELVSGLVPLGVGEVIDRWHPTLALVQMFIEPGEPANYAGYWFENPREGYLPKHILMTAGLTDEYTPPETIFALAAAGRVPIISPVLQTIPLFDAFGIEPAGTPPYTGNVANGSTSAGLIQVQNRGHFVIQRDVSVQQRYRQFIRSVFDGNHQIF